jgi:hypothetical protein
MPIPLLAAAGIAQGVGGIIKGLFGGGQKRQAHKILDEIGDSPNMEIPNEILQNQRLASTRAKIGLPSEQYALAMQNLQRQQVNQLRGAQDRRGGLAAISGIGQGYNDSMLKLDSANAQARMQNEKTLYGINNNVAGWKQNVWKNNVLDKWNRKYQYANSLLGVGNQNFVGGIDQVLGGVGTAVGGFGAGGGTSNGGVPADISYLNYQKPWQTQTGLDYQLPG